MISLVVDGDSRIYLKNLELPTFTVKEKMTKKKIENKFQPLCADNPCDNVCTIIDSNEPDNICSRIDKECNKNENVFVKNDGRFTRPPIQQQEIRVIQEQRAVRQPIQQQEIRVIQEQRAVRQPIQQQEIRGIQEQRAVRQPIQQQEIRGIQEQRSDRPPKQQQEIRGIQEQQAVRPPKQQQEIRGIQEQRGFRPPKQQQEIRVIQEQQAVRPPKQQQEIRVIQEQRQDCSKICQDVTKICSQRRVVKTEYVKPNTVETRAILENTGGEYLMMQPEIVKASYNDYETKVVDTSETIDFVMVNDNVIEILNSDGGNEIKIGGVTRKIHAKSFAEIFKDKYVDIPELFVKTWMMIESAQDNTDLENINNEINEIKSFMKTISYEKNTILNKNEMEFMKKYIMKLCMAEKKLPSACANVNKYMKYTAHNVINISQSEGDEYGFENSSLTDKARQVTSAVARIRSKILSNFSNWRP